MTHHHRRSRDWRSSCRLGRPIEETTIATKTSCLYESRLVRVHENPVGMKRKVRAAAPARVLRSGRNLTFGYTTEYWGASEGFAAIVALI